jgi:hypothetical protein
MHPHGEPKGERAESRLLALQLIELAIAAGWKSRECIEFAREAHEFVMSTLPESASGRVAGSSEPRGRIDGSSKKISERSDTPKWVPDTEARRIALQRLADQNRTMRESAEILGISPALVSTVAARLKIRFHGRRGRKLHPTASKNSGAPTKRGNGTAAGVLRNGAVLKRLPVDRPADYRMKRRCPSCNRVFEPTQINHYICDDCESCNFAGP